MFITENSSVVAFVSIPLCGFARVGCQLLFFLPSTDTNYFSFFKADDVFLKDTIEAAAWCQLQSFTDHVSLPMVIGVEGAEQQALLAELKSVDRSCPEESPNRIEPFQFVFNSKKDYEMFCVEMFDRRKLKVFASRE